MTLVLCINDLNDFYEMTHFARKPNYDELDFEASQNKFILTVSRPSPEGRCFIELQLRPEFFPHYAIDTDQILHRTISSQLFFTTLIQMNGFGYDFMTLTLTHHLDTLQLSFSILSDPDDPSYDVYFPFLLTYQDLNLYRILSQPYVAIRLVQLQTMLANINDSHVTLTVTLTTSQVTFTEKDMGRDAIFVSNVEGGDCVIGGVGEGEEAQFEIVLNPIESFDNILSDRSNLENVVGIGKSDNNNNNRGVIALCRGSYVQYLFYSSDQ